MAKMLEEDDRAGEDRFEIFRGMCEAIEKTESRRRRGLGAQGLVRSKPFVNTMHALALMSPLAYKKLGTLFGGPTLRHLQYVDQIC